MLPNTAVSAESAADAGLIAGFGLLLTAAAARLATRRLPDRRR
jgi:hypothetical protein